MLYNIENIYVVRYLSKLGQFRCPGNSQLQLNYRHSYVQFSWQFYFYNSATILVRSCKCNLVFPKNKFFQLQ